MESFRTFDGGWKKLGKDVPTKEGVQRYISRQEIAQAIGAKEVRTGKFGIFVQWEEPKPVQYPLKREGVERRFI